MSRPRSPIMGSSRSIRTVSRSVPIRRASRCVEPAADDALPLPRIVAGQQGSGARAPLSPDLDPHPGIGLDVAHIGGAAAVFGDDPEGVAVRSVPDGVRRGSPEVRPVSPGGRSPVAQCHAREPLASIGLTTWRARAVLSLRFQPRITRPPALHATAERNPAGGGGDVRAQDPVQVEQRPVERALEPPAAADQQDAVQERYALGQRGQSDQRAAVLTGSDLPADPPGRGRSDVGSPRESAGRAVGRWSCRQDSGAGLSRDAEGALQPHTPRQPGRVRPRRAR